MDLLITLAQVSCRGNLMKLSRFTADRWTWTKVPSFDWLSSTLPTTPLVPPRTNSSTNYYLFISPCTTTPVIMR